MEKNNLPLFLRLLTLGLVTNGFERHVTCNEIYCYSREYSIIEGYVLLYNGNYNRESCPMPQNMCGHIWPHKSRNEILYVYIVRSYMYHYT